MTVTLIENFRAVFYTPFYAAFALEAFAAEGVDVRLKTSAQPLETPNALASGFVGRIVEHTDGMLWLATNAGVEVFDPNLGRVVRR